MVKCLTVMPGGLDNPVAGGFFSKACWKGTNTRDIQCSIMYSTKLYSKSSIAKPSFFHVIQITLF